jgi:hypothetical protein
MAGPPEPKRAVSRAEQIDASWFDGVDALMGYQSDKQLLGYYTELARKTQAHRGGRLKRRTTIARVAIIVLAISLVVLFAWWFR